MTLARAVTDLGWPHETSIMAPTGAGPAVHLDLARNKVGQALTGLEGAQNAQLGVLSPDPDTHATDAPLALVCAFQQKVPESTISEIHRLAWNFCRTPLLLTVDTEKLRAFSCCEPPAPPQTIQHVPAEITDIGYNFGSKQQQLPTLVDQASHSLHWFELTTGRLFQKHDNRFALNTRADVLLLSNLQLVRQKLHSQGLTYDIIHDLLARIIFIQFLFDRRDTDGKTALNESYLERLRKAGILSRTYSTFSQILANHQDCYSLFWYLDDRFNGDLFPGHDCDSHERSTARNEERSAVQSRHLNTLSDFVSGSMEMKTGQRSLWPAYSFDIIPLEFISSIYEAFVTKTTGTVYTPAHLVDFVLDGILPWDGKEWDLKILDPACGSGIFLVKAYQRLIHRWKNANPGERIGSPVLRTLLERNLFGVDNDPHAVRTASFSLYLAMCDEIDPKHYWTQVRFPSLRNRNIFARDFFTEDSCGTRTKADAASYDIVLGNAPWGQNSVTPLSLEWAKNYHWPVSYKDIGPLFLGKSVALCKRNGRLSLIQPGSTLLFNNSSPAYKTREKIFGEYRVKEVVNLSALRFGLFKRAVGPAVLITLSPKHTDGESFSYICPKPARCRASDYFRIVVSQYDVHDIHPQEAVERPIVWSALIWGGRRDVKLLEQLARLPTIAKYKKAGRLKSRQGIIRGKSQIAQPAILGKRILETDDFPDGVFLEFSANRLKVNTNPYTHKRDSTNFEAFEPLQLLVKMAWTMDKGRFGAALVKPATEGVICTRHYLSVRAEKDDQCLLEAACLSYNSAIAAYYLFLRSGRFANYRPEPYVWELLDVPMPKNQAPPVAEIRSKEHLDDVVVELFELKPSQRVHIEDALQYALADFKGDSNSPGRSSTNDSGPNNKNTDFLHAYCNWFLRVLKAGFGSQRELSATIFVEDGAQTFPVRIVAFHFQIERDIQIVEEQIGSGKLASQLKNIYNTLANDVGTNLSYRRIARVFDRWTIEGKSVPTLLIAKPDEARYWTRSIAMRDADDVSAEILQRMHGRDNSSQLDAN